MTHRDDRLAAFDALSKRYVPIADDCVFNFDRDPSEIPTPGEMGVYSDRRFVFLFSSLRPAPFRRQSL